MKKYEACAALCEIRERVASMRGETLAAMEHQKQKETKPDDPEQNGRMDRYYAKELNKLDSWIAALDIAGSSLTK